MAVIFNNQFTINHLGGCLYYVRHLKLKIALAIYASIIQIILKNKFKQPNAKELIISTLYSLFTA